MGFIDLAILLPTISILVITSVLLFLGLKSTKEEVKRESYKRTYTPIIMLSILVLVLYFGIINIGDAVLKNIH